MSEIITTISWPDVMIGFIIGFVGYHLAKFVYRIVFESKAEKEYGMLKREIDELEFRHEINKLKRRKGMLERKFPRG